jgi:CheY-like chemotaxis protein
MPKILLVEDNELNRDMLSRRLARKGYEILLAEDGAKGVAAAAAERPDLVLMDMSLPVLDGWEATRRLKADPGTRAIPVIALTAHAMSTDRERAKEAGCDDYDTKPVELPRLLEKIERLLRRRRGRGRGDVGAAEGGPVPGSGARDERERRARLAHVRQELLAPVNAIAGYADILRDEAGRLGLEGMTPDLDRILAAGGVLLELVERLSDLGAVSDPQAGEGTTAVQERLRHDLRNPLSAIKGYGEMLLEDLDDLGGGALRRTSRGCWPRRPGCSRASTPSSTSPAAGRAGPRAGPTRRAPCSRTSSRRSGRSSRARRDRARREGSSSSTTTRATATCWRAAWRARATGRSRRARAARRCGSSSSRTSTWSCSTW